MTKKKEQVSLAIGNKRIREIKCNKKGVVSHKSSKRWEDFIKYPRKKVRFFDTVYGEEVICCVVKATAVNKLRERVIEIEVKL